MHAILEKAKSFEAEGNLDMAIDAILYGINGLLDEGWFSEIDRVLAEAQTGVGLYLLVSLLMICKDSKSRFKHYGKVFNTARLKALTEHDEEATKMLMAGLD